MDHRREIGTVIRRQFVESVVRFRIGVLFLICSADEPEHRWNVPLGAETAEVLAPGDRSHLSDLIVIELRAKGVDDGFGCAGVVFHAVE